MASSPPPPPAEASTTAENFPSAPPVSTTVVNPSSHNTMAMPDDFAETAAAAAALVVDSVVEDTVTAVITNNSLPSSSNAQTNASAVAVAEPAPVSTVASSVHTEITPATASWASVVNINTNTNLQPQQKSQPQILSETVRSQPPTIAPSAPAIKATVTSVVAPAELAAKNIKSTVQTYGSLQKSKRKERLEQNRISARESRKRKKSMIEELQRTVIGLTAENKDLKGRNQSLRVNLAEIGLKYPNNPSIQAILNAVPTQTTQHQQQQPPVPNPAAIKMDGQAMTTNFFPQALTNEGVPIVPMVAPGATPPMMVPYMYIPQAMQTPGGLVQIVAQSVPRGQPVVMPAPSPVPVVGAPLPIAAPQPLTTALGTQQQQHIVIAPQPAPPPMAPIQAGSQAHILPTPPVTMPATIQATAPLTVAATIPTTMPATIQATAPSTVAATIPATMPATIQATAPSTVASTMPANMPAPSPIAPVAPLVASTAATTPPLVAPSVMLSVPDPMAATESIEATKEEHV